MPPAVTVNARYLLHPVTGIQRYAREIRSRLPPQCELIEAPSWATGARGHLWEQTDLRRRSRGSLLWSPCQTGPMRHPRQIVTIHDLGTFDHRKSYAGAFAAWYRLCLSSVVASSVHVIAVSSFTKDRLLHHVRIDPDRITVIPEGAGERFRRAGDPEIADLRERLGIGADQRMILSLGSLEPRKNVASLLDAWRRIGAGAEHDAVLVLVGRHGDSAVFEDTALGPIPERVLFTGYLRDEDLPTIYSAARAFVYPSLYEGFGLPVLEAMSCGTPVVTSNCASLPEVAGDAAHLVDPRSTAEIATALLRCLEDETWIRDASRAGLEQAKQFSWDVAAKATWELLEAHTA